MKDIVQKPKSIRSLVRDIDKNVYDFELPIQRRAGIWKPQEESLFIDTLLRDYPLYPALVNKHTDTGVQEVVDFKQRFTALKHFAHNELRLSKDLAPIVINDETYEIAEKKLKQLDEAVQSKFYDRDISIITMFDATPEEIKDIFERINMGHPLTNGHRRSTIEGDEARTIIYRLSSHDFMVSNLTRIQINKNIDRDLIIQLLMLTEAMDERYVLTSLQNKDMNKFLNYYNDVLADENTHDAAVANADAIEEALNVLGNAFTDEDKRIKLNILLFAIYGMFYALRIGKSEDVYIDWLKNFIAGYDENEEYKQYCTSGTANAGNVKGRLDYFVNAINNL